MQQSQIIEAIEASPLNMGMRGEDWFAQPGNISIAIDDDIFLFDYESPGLYQIHFLACEGGRATIDHAKQAFQIMFEQRGADLLFGLVPAYRRDVKLMARWVGGKFARTVPTEFGPCELYIVPKGRIQ